MAGAPSPDSPKRPSSRRPPERSRAKPAARVATRSKSGLYITIAAGAFLLLLGTYLFYVFQLSREGKELSKQIDEHVKAMKEERRLSEKSRATPSPPPRSAPKPDAPLPPITEIYTDSRNGFSLPIPRSWQDARILEPSAVLSKVGNVPRRAGVAVSTMDPLPGFLEGERTWDDVVRAIESLMKGKVQRRVEHPTGEAPGLIFTIAGSGSGKRMNYLMYQVMARPKSFMISWSSAPKDFGVMEPLFESWSRQFRLIDPSTDPASKAPIKVSLETMDLALPEHGLKIPTPRSWRMVPPPSSSVAAFYKTDVPAQASLNVVVGKTPPGLAEGTTTWEDHLRDTATKLERAGNRNLRHPRKEDLPCGGKPGFLVTFTSTLNGKDIAGFQYMVAAGPTFYTVTGVCPPEHLEAFMPLFEKCARGIALIEKKKPPAPRPAPAPAPKRPVAVPAPRPAPKPVKPPPAKPLDLKARPTVRLTPAKTAPKGKQHQKRKHLKPKGINILVPWIEDSTRITLLNQLEWGRGHRSVFAASQEGRVFRIAVPEFIETHQADLGARNRILSLARSKAGLIAVTGKQELVVMDESNLKILRRIKVKAGAVVATSPVTTIGFVPRSPHLDAIDLEKGEIIRTYTPPELWTRHGEKILKDEKTGADFELYSAGMSPDGKTLVTIHLGRFSRFLIQGSKLTYQAMGPIVARTRMPKLWFSHDSRFVATPECGFSAGPVPGHIPLPKGGTYIYDLKDLSRPATTLVFDRNPAIVGRDPFTGVFYTGNRTAKLAVFGPDGSPVKEFRALGTTPGAILVHPETSEVLLQTGNWLYWLEPLP